MTIYYKFPCYDLFLPCLKTALKQEGYNFIEKSIESLAQCFGGTTMPRDAFNLGVTLSFAEACSPEEIAMYRDIPIQGVVHALLEARRAAWESAG